MEEKLITIVVLPYSKAHILEMRLESKGIECDLEELNMAEGTTSYSVKVKVMEKDVPKAMPILEGLIGKKPDKPVHEQKMDEQHILVPVDFSVDSEKACKLAFKIASHIGTKIVFLHCYINPLIHSIPFSDIYTYDSSLVVEMEYAEKDANEKFQKFIGKMSDEIGKQEWEKITTEFIIKSGYPDEDILAYSEKNHPQLIVMGRSGNTLHSETMGSVTADVIYNARVPVLIVPEESTAKELSGFSKVLYATNFDEKDFTVIDNLMMLLTPFNTKVVCAHVGQPEGSRWDLAKMEGMKEILHKKYGAREFECHLLEGKDISESLQELIDKEAIDILSLTTHKRNMISRLFNPGVAKKMIFHTKTPLLVFHA